MNKVYQHVFFDLDHTLWDFENNSKQTLSEFWLQHGLDKKIELNFEGFHHKFLEINATYWELFRMGHISKETLRTERFSKLFHAFNFFDDKLIAIIASDYVLYGPQKSGLIDYAKDLLTYLEKKYVLHIITNGFTDVQNVKLQCSGIYSSFKEIITSETAGFKKPNPGIFEYALKCVNASADNCLMIGDELYVDIMGAKKSGIDQVYFNPKGVFHSEKVTHEIKSLKELFDLL